MRPETPKLLEDVRRAGVYILEKTTDKSLDDYLTDDLLRPAVERHFEIIGEALNRLGRRDPETLEQIPDHAHTASHDRNVAKSFLHIRVYNLSRLINGRESLPENRRQSL